MSSIPPTALAAFKASDLSHIQEDEYGANCEPRDIAKGAPFMELTVLLNKLIAIERSIGTANNNRLRDLVYDAQDCLLTIQKRRAESFLANAWRRVSPGVDEVREVS